MSDELVSNASAEASRSNELASQLTLVQLTALQQLGTGASMIEAARSAGVDRRTLYNWIHQDPQFRAAYNAWQHELLESGRSRALAMTDKALSTVDTAIEKGNVSAALQLVRQLGVLRPSKPGETDPRRLSKQRKLAARRRKVRQKQKDAQLEEQEEKLRKKQEERYPKYNVGECTEMIKWFREQREQAVLREAEKYGMTPEEIRKDYLEEEAEWAEDDARKLARLQSGPAVTPGDDEDPSSSSQSVADEDSDTEDSPTTVKAKPALVPPAVVRAIRKAPEPYVEPDDEPWVRYS